MLENFTGALLEPYVGTDNYGISMLDADELQRVVVLLDSHDFQVHMHTIGDRAVRDALDALESAARANGRRDTRHHFAHLQLIHPDDLPRFAELGVIANVSPLWACRSGYVDELTEPVHRPRALGAHVPVRQPAAGRRAPGLRERLDGVDRRPAPAARGRGHARSIRRRASWSRCFPRRGSTSRPRSRRSPPAPPT